MKRAATQSFARSRGFTLIESIIVLAVLGIAAAGIASMQGNIFSGRSDNRLIEVGTQLMQECAEQVLATRQGTGTGTGYDSVTTSTCSSLGSYGGFSAPSVTVTADTSAACPPGGTCKTVAISVSKSGSSLAPITLELVSY
jgi:prepilin-type N-terminal cleavage/methylation domain-containing protein